MLFYLIDEKLEAISQIAHFVIDIRRNFPERGGSWQFLTNFLYEKGPNLFTLCIPSVLILLSSKYSVVYLQSIPGCTESIYFSSGTWKDFGLRFRQFYMRRAQLE